VLVRAIGLKYHVLISSSKGTRTEKKEAKVVLPKGAALQVRKKQPKRPRAAFLFNKKLRSPLSTLGRPARPL